ncbi:hypothetical protein CK203_034402 [Vitis vinifera]|uniref:Uncharacterized protein n=1 Tax=Vitis vinifera TaxID=29760 RepID=A0A438HZL8_VITVI|nr:hypothetical protein CK203_034402 [Vitis vinifera]
MASLLCCSSFIKKLPVNQGGALSQAVFLSQKGRGFYKFPEVEEGYKRVGRIAMEGIDDYAGTGANTHHDPKPPGRV